MSLLRLLREYVLTAVVLRVVPLIIARLLREVESSSSARRGRRDNGTHPKRGLEAAPNIVPQTLGLLRDLKDTHAIEGLLELADHERVGVHVGTVAAVESGAHGVQVVDGACAFMSASSYQASRYGRK